MAHEEIRGERRQIAKLATDKLGLEPNVRRVFEGQILAAGREADILRLPDAPENEDPIQDPDTGGMAFVLGISDPDGPDLVL